MYSDLFSSHNIALKAPPFGSVFTSRLTSLLVCVRSETCGLRVIHAPLRRVKYTFSGWALVTTSPVNVVSVKSELRSGFDAFVNSWEKVIPTGHTKEEELYDSYLIKDDICCEHT
ncbi:hypothetical protein CRENBAI_015346 [Crenichthys baileyi]|uniref:Uncharacterized protein n=1 Tax=Crenichthys baileyi TaxID=28760 RepID=A0AAV9R1Q2_9TELE